MYGHGKARHLALVEVVLSALGDGVEGVTVPKDELHVGHLIWATIRDD